MFSIQFSVRALAVFVSVGSAAAQLPTARLDAVFPIGVKAGAAAEITVSGADLDGPRRLVFDHPGLSAEYLEGGRFKVSAAAEVPPGIYQLRFDGAWGSSSPRWFAVGSSDEAVVDPGSSDPAKATAVTVGTVYNGRIEAGKAQHFKLPGSAGARYFAEVFAERLGTRLDAVLVALDSSGIEMGRSREDLGGDPLLELAPASDGEITLQVSDFQARGGEQYGYRLQVRSAPQIDMVAPLSGQPGTRQKFTVIGRNLPGASPSADGRERIEVEIDVPSEGVARRDGPVAPAAAGMRGFHYGIGDSNRVFIAHASAPPVADAGGNLSPPEAQALTIPCEVGGQFPPGARKWYEFQAAGGKTYAIEVFAHRTGSPCDPVLVARKITAGADGAETVADLGNADDAADNIGGRRYRTDHRDPIYRFTADADFKVRLSLEDRFGTGSPFRLVVREARPDFHLIASLPMPGQGDNNNGKRVSRGGLALRRGEASSIEVLALRRDGFDREIALVLEGLPEGFQSAPATIGKGQHSAGIRLLAGPDAPAWSGGLRVRGTAKIGEAEVTREAETAAIHWTVNDADAEQVIARVAPGELGAASVEERAPLIGAPVEAKVWESSLGAQLDIPVKLAKHAETRDKIIVEVVDLHGVGKKPPRVEVPKDQDEGTISIAFMNNRDENRFQAGTFQFVLRTSCKIGYRRGVAEAEAAVAARDAAAMALEEKKQARDAAKAELDAARAASAETDAQKQQRIADAQAKFESAEKVFKEAEAAHKQAAEEAKRLEEAAKPKDAQYSNLTLPITVRIEPAPVRVTVPAEPSKGARGAKVELPVQLQRLYGFADAVTLQAKLPEGAKGISAADVAVAKEAGEAKLVFEVAADAAPGEHSLELIAKMKFNGIDLERRHPVKLVITES